MKCYMVICDLNEKYESDIKTVGEIMRHFNDHIDVAIEISKCHITIQRDTFNIIIDNGKKLIDIYPCEYGNIHIY